jgi:hypothetical protein
VGHDLYVGSCEREGGPVVEGLASEAQASSRPVFWNIYVQMQPKIVNADLAEWSKATDLNYSVISVPFAGVGSNPTVSFLGGPFSLRIFFFCCQSFSSLASTYRSRATSYKHDCGAYLPLTATREAAGIPFSVHQVYPLGMVLLSSRGCMTSRSPNRDYAEYVRTGYVVEVLRRYTPAWRKSVPARLGSDSGKNASCESTRRSVPISAGRRVADRRPTR